MFQVSIHSLQLRREKYIRKHGTGQGDTRFNPLSSIKKREIIVEQEMSGVKFSFNPLSSIKKREI